MIKKDASLLKVVAITAAGVSLCTGCITNPYTQFYHDHTGGLGVDGSPNLVHAASDPVVQRGSNPMQDSMEMMRNGYICIGESRFNGGSASPLNAKYHARRVGAELVLLYSRYTDTVSGSTPVTVPDRRVSTSRGSATAYGSGGFATAHGSSYSISRGTKTMYVPYNVRRHDYLATFWNRAKSFSFGAQIRDLTSEQRQAIQSNKGAAVFVVVRGTPAFHNDILDGDIIREMNGIEIIDGYQCLQMIEESRGKAVSLVIYRDGQKVDKKFTLDP